MSRLRKRTVKIILSPNDPRDPRAIFSAVEDVFRPTDVEVKVGEPPAEEASVQPVARPMAQELVETEARKRVGDHLASKNEKIKAERARQGLDPNQRLPEPPEEVVKKRQTLREFIRSLTQAGWRFAIRTLWEAVKEEISRRIGSS